jgi:precorrin-8X/cobalt-precorrin-8 methylmutase
VRRAIHTSADFDYARTMVFSADAVAKGIEALRRGRGIVTDTNMALAGIGKARRERFGIRAACFVADPDVARAAYGEGVTRSILAMRKGTADPGNGIFVIGNAPTALLTLTLCGGASSGPDRRTAGRFVGGRRAGQAHIRGFDKDQFITNRGREGQTAAAVVTLLIMARMYPEHFIAMTEIYNLLLLLL